MTSTDSMPRGSPGDDRVQLNLPQLIPKLPAETLAQFEALSGLLIVNASTEQLIAAGRRLDEPGTEDAPLLAAINHETYHYFQAICTGYMFLHHNRASRVLLRRLSRFGWRHQLDHLVWSASMRTLLWLLTPLLGEHKNRWMGWAVVFRQQTKMARMRAAAAPGDFSVAGALLPELRKELDALQQELRRVNSSGLSPLHIIEGGALVFQYALTYTNDWRDRFDRDWSDYDDLYRRAFEMTRGLIGERSYQAFLPASALALFYERPQDAFIPMVNALASGGPGEYAKMARAIAAEPPRLPNAGRFLGTANDVKRRSWRWQIKLKRFDAVLADLNGRKGELDEIDLLTDPVAATRIQSFPLGIVTQDRPFAGTGNVADVYAGLLIANYVLGTTKFPRAHQEAMDEAVNFIRAGSPFHTREDSQQTTEKPH